MNKVDTANLMSAENIDQFRGHYLDEIRNLLKSEFDVSSVDAEGNTCLHLVCIPNLGWGSDSLKVIQLVANKVANINTRNKAGWTSLMLASTLLPAEYTQVLLQKGADPNLTDDTGRSALMLAALYCKADIVTALLKAGADPVARDSDGNTPLHYGSRSNAILNSLLKAKADARSVNSEGDTALHFLIPRKLPLLDTNGWEKEYLAPSMPEIKSVQTLIKSGCSINAVNDVGETPLHRLASLLVVSREKESVNKKIFQAMLDEGASKSAITKSGDIPAYHALRYPLPVGTANFMLPDPPYDLLQSIIAGDEKAAIEMIGKGTDPNYKTGHGWGALHLAVASGSSDDLLDALLSAGADPNAMTSNDETPLEFAVAYHNKSAAVRVIKKGARINDYCGKPGSYLRLAVWMEDEELMRDALHKCSADGEIRSTLQMLSGEMDRSLLKFDGTSAAINLLGYIPVGMAPALTRDTGEGVRSGTKIPNMLSLLLDKAGSCSDIEVAPFVRVLQHMVASSYPVESIIEWREVIQKLLEKDAEPNVSQISQVVLYTAIKKSTNPQFPNIVRQVLALLLQKGMVIKGNHRWESNLFTVAIEAGDEYLLDKLLETGQELPENPLAASIAVSKPSVAIVSKLLSAGARIWNVEDLNRAIFQLSDSGNKHDKAILPLLSEALISSAESSEDIGKTLAQAIKNGDQQTFEGLVDRALLSQIVDASNENFFLHLAVASDDDVAHRIMISALLSRGMDPNARNAKGETPLMLTTGPKVIKALIDAGADPNARDNDGNTALMKMGCRWKVEKKSLAALVSGGSDFNAIASNGDTVLMKFSDPDLIQILIAAGTDPDFENPEGKTALMHWSTNPGYGGAGLKAVEQLLSSGAKIDKVDHEGKSALMYAAGRHGEMEIARLLLSKGALLNRKSSNSRTAFGYSLATGFDKDLLRYLIEAGADINECVLVDDVSVSGFGKSLEVGDAPFSIWLLEKGAQLNESTLGILGEDWAELSTKIRENEESSASSKSVPLTNLVKICMAVPQLFKSRITATDPGLAGTLHELVQQNTQQPEVTDDELPDLLKIGNWPPVAQNRSPIVLAKLNLPEFEPSIAWKEDEQDVWIRESEGRYLRHKPKPDGDEKLLAAVTALSKKTAEISIYTLLRASDELAVQIWNENAAEFAARIRVPYGWSSVLGIKADGLRFLIARYGLAVLPGMLALAAKKAEVVAKAMGPVDAPSVAPVMARLLSAGKVPRVARAWLLRHPEAAIHDLIPLAVGKPGKDRDACEAALRFLASKGSCAMVEEIAIQFGGEASKAVAEIISADTRIDYLPKKFPEMPRFLDIGLFPAPLLADSGNRLPRTAIQALAGMMSISTYDAQYPGLAAIIELLDRQSLAKFSWAVFELWNKSGDSNNNWMFQGLAYFGDDAIARRLTPYIRDWPAQNGMARAVMGLEILAGIGTDAAIAQIQAISVKNRYKPIQERAQTMLEAIAEARELTAEQLEDRLVPDFGLDAEGAMTLDFGPRQFKVTFDERLNPLIFDSEGNLTKELPKAAKDDDKDMAKTATLTWSDLKKEMKPVAGIQIMRMEAAMVGERYWTGDEFKRLLVAHPLMRHLASRLVWATFTGKGKFKSTFRAGDAGNLVNLKEAPFELADDSLVGIPHPLQFEAELEEWKKCFSRFKLSQPFPQIVRKTYAEKDDTEVDYFGLQGAVVPSKALKGLKALGWESEMIGIRDFIGGFTRSFPSGTADLAIEPGVSMTDFNSMSDEQTLEVRLPKLSPVAYSEVIRELMLIKK
ncbi:MAG: ankyrin repeat domain-containing protein [Pseudomonadota bacterium]